MIKNNKGFTIVEVLVALILFSLVSSALVLLLMSESKFRQKADDRLLAYAIAENHIEQIKGMDFILTEENLSKEIEMSGKSWFVNTELIDEQIVVRGSDYILRLQEMAVSVTKGNDTLPKATINFTRETYR
jgi:type II secretion system protein I